MSRTGWLGDSFVSVLFIRLKWETQKRKWSISCSSFDLFWMHWVTKTNVSYSLMCYGLSLCFLFGMLLKRKNILKTMQWRFQEIEAEPSGLSILAQHIEVVHFYKYLRVPLDEKFYWSLNTDALYTKAQSQLFFLWRLRFSGVCVLRLSQWWPMLSLMLLCTDKTSGWTSWWASQLLGRRLDT